ncbi:hypothetical protein ACFFGT_02825 [Mucilaginibacter angelicae]|uniref:S1 motif domain-containing protein n=1 Tax=Mucilaginibacter angelicae TaxID=869718 RepID=A0ABV6L377_9SPHI
MIIGPQVAFVDDIENQITPLKNILQDLNTGTIFFDARPELAAFPVKPVESVKLIFLDLYYKADFDAEIPAQWVSTIIPKNARYYLVIWSKDTHHRDDLLSVLNQIDVPPTYVEAWQKTDFPPDFNFKGKVTDLIKKISDEETINGEVIYGEIVDVEDDGVLINCCINTEKPTYQVRRFDMDLLAKVTKLEIGTYVRIHLYTKPGSRLVDIFEETKDLKTLFDTPDFFRGLEGNAFFIEK